MGEQLKSDQQDLETSLMQLGKCKSTPERQAFILDLVCKIEKSQLVLLKISQRLGVDCLSEDNRLDMYLQLIQ